MADRAVIYNRASTPDQEEKGSIERQIHDATEYARRRNYLLADEDVFSDVFTGKTAGARRGFYDLLGRLERGDVQVLVTYDNKRLARNDLDTAQLALKCREHKVRIETVQGGRFNLAEPIAKCMFTVFGAFAELNRSEILVQMVAGKAHTVRNGHWGIGRPPFGYRVEGPPARKMLRPTEPAAENVRRCFQLYADGWTYKQIAELLNQEHAAAPNKSGRWYPSDVGVLLRRPVYIGWLHFNDQVMKGLHEPLVSRDLWDQVQARRRERANAHGSRTTRRDWSAAVEAA